MASQAIASGKNSSEAVFGELGNNWGWLFGLGVLFIILGVVGLGGLVGLSIVGSFFFGVLIIVGGVAQLMEAIKCKAWKGVAFHVMIAVLYIVGGFFVIQDPLAASVLMTWVLAVVLICVGVARAIMALQMRATGTWIFPMLGGLISIILGGLILAKWPLSGLFVIGLFIAIELITNGWTYIFIALAARKAGKRTTA